MKGEVMEAFKEYVRPHYVDKDPAHDFNHIIRILRRLESWIGEISPRSDETKMIFIACFHGLRAKMKSDDRFHTETVGFLKSLGWDGEKIKDGLISLERYTKDPQSMEEKLVHDANNLERLGAFGIAKAFTTGGARGQTYEETSDIFEYQFLDETKFYTPVANQHAQEGKKYAKEFMRKLRNELSHIQ